MTTSNAAVCAAEGHRTRTTHPRSPAEAPAYSVRGLHDTALISGYLESAIRFFREVL